MSITCATDFLSLVLLSLLPGNPHNLLYVLHITYVAAEAAADDDDSDDDYMSLFNLLTPLPFS